MTNASQMTRRHSAFRLLLVGLLAFCVMDSGDGFLLSPVAWNVNDNFLDESNEFLWKQQQLLEEERVVIIDPSAWPAIQDVDLGSKVYRHSRVRTTAWCVTSKDTPARDKDEWRTAADVVCVQVAMVLLSPCCMAVSWSW